MAVYKIFGAVFCVCFLGMTGYAQQTIFTIDKTNTAQTIENFGASGAWYSEGIGKYWPDAKKERMAEALFSKRIDTAGNPAGIGLSAWRFNIGGGTAEQGDSSGIRNTVRRVESFLAPDGTFHWKKQSGYVWFVRKARQYGVENLIAFSNTPPVQFTKNGLGFNLKKNYQTNLRDDRYGDFAGFLATVLEQFKKEGLPFNYVCPVNEPQWDWSNRFGEMNQEGSPWHNKAIYRITVALDSALLSKGLTTRILLPEAGTLTALYAGDGHAAKQIQTFFGSAGPYNTKRLKTVLPVVAGHSYFTDNGDSSIVSVRSRLRDTAFRYNVRFWQTEYSLLGDGYKEGRGGRIPAMDCALFLAKMIHHDLVVANASAWQYWNAWEPGRSDQDIRYNLIALRTNAANTEGDFTVTKNLWALGHYSRFIRPGMKRIVTARSDGLDAVDAAKDLMLSAFAGEKEMVIVAINYSPIAKEIGLKLPGVKKIKSIRQFTTTAAADDNMKSSPLPSVNQIKLNPRSLTTVVIAY